MCRKVDTKLDLPTWSDRSEKGGPPDETQFHGHRFSGADTLLEPLFYMEGSWLGAWLGTWLGGGGWERGWELLYYSEASLELLEPLFYMEESWLGAWLEADVLHGGVAKVAGAAVLHGGVAVG